MAHTNTGADGHTNTGYNNHVNTGANEHTNTGYNNHNNTGYNNHSNYGYTNHANYHYYNYTQSGYSKYRQYYTRHTNYNNYNCYSKYQNNYYTNSYSNHANYHYYNHTNTGGYHTNTGYNNHTNTGAQGHTNTGYSNHNNQGAGTHANSGYSNHLNYTNNHAPTLGGTVTPTTPSAYYRDSVALSWSSASDTSAEQLQEHTVTLSTGFTEYGGAYSPMKVYKTKEGTVHIRGLVNTTVSSGTIFTLPSGWRPTVGSLIFGQSHGYHHCRVDVLQDGAVRLCNTQNPSASGWITLNISFNADANGWEDIPLDSRYINYSGVGGYWTHARCKKTASGITFVEGLIKRDTYSADNVTVGHLPSGIRPSGRLISHGCAMDKTCRIDYTEAGAVYADVQHTTGDGSWISITGCFMSESNTDSWTNLTLSNSWVNYGGGYSVARAKRLKSGEVFLEGLIKSGDVTNGIAAATLPSNMIPLHSTVSATTFKAGASETSMTTTYIRSGSGQVSLYASNASWTSIVTHYITGEQQADSKTYTLQYAHKTPLGTYGAWTTIQSGLTGTSHTYSLSSHASGFIKFRVIATDGIENSSYVYSEELRVLKYTAPSIPSEVPGNLIEDTDYQTIALELNALATEVGVASDINDAVFAEGTIVSANDVNTLASKANEIQTVLDNTSPVPSVSPNDVIYAADINLLKDFLSNK